MPGGPSPCTSRYYTAASSAGGSIGLLVGGMLTSWASWRWVMLVNVPVGIVIMALTVRCIDQPPRGQGKLDVFGAVTGTAGMVGVTYGFIHAADAGWGKEQTFARTTTSRPPSRDSRSATASNGAGVNDHRGRRPGDHRRDRPLSGVAAPMG